MEEKNMKSEGASFIDELIQEAEEKENKLMQSHLDLILIEIRKLEEQIEKNFNTAAEEREIIKNWALERNSMLNSRIQWLSKRLEGFLRDEKLKSLDLPNGKCRLRKQSDKISIVDEEKFFNNATSALLNITETVKPDLLKIRVWMKKTGRIPQGVEIIPQEDEKFSYTIKRNDNGTKKKIGATNKPTNKSAVVI
jgi:hypothetical protein